MRFTAILFLLVVRVLNVHAQNDDTSSSLGRNNIDDTALVKKYNDIAWQWMFDNPDSAIYYARKGYNVALYTGSSKWMSDSYNTLAVYHYLTANYMQSLFINKLALIIRLAQRDRRGLMSSWNNLGSAEKELGNFKGELDCYHQALKYAYLIKDSFTASRIIMNMADAYKRLNQFESALEYHHKALQYLLTAGNMKQIGVGYLNIFGVFVEMKQFDSAAAYIPKLKLYVEPYADKFILSKYHQALSSYYKDTGHIPEAIEQLTMATALNEQLKNENSLSTNYINLGACYEATGQWQKALTFYEKALRISTTLHNLQWQRQSNLGVATTSAALRNYQKAYQHLLRYTVIDDSLRGDKIQHDYARLKILYETAIKDKQIAQLQSENDKKELSVKQAQVNAQRKNFLIAAIIAAVIIILLLVLLRIRRLRFEKEKEIIQVKQQTQENERLRLAKDVHDELGSGLSRVRYMAELLSKEIFQPNQKQHIQSIQTTTADIIENMRDLIWALNPENTTLDGLVARIREYYSDYTEDIPLDVIFNIEDSIPAIPVSTDVHRNMMMVAKEILQNIVKHAQADVIRVTVKRESDSLMFQATDNGVGFDISNPSVGNGLKNIRQRIQNIGGVCIIDSIIGKGTQITIHLTNLNYTIS